MSNFALSVLVTLVVTVEPLGTALLFLGLTPGMGMDERRAIALRAVAIATAVLLVFALGGAQLLELLQISTAAFQIAGGLLLLLASIDLIFAHRTGLSSITTDETREAAATHDIAVFPLAIPLIAGPGAMTAVILLMQRASGTAEMSLVLGLLLVVMIATALTLLLAPRLVQLLGITGVNVVARVSGILLAALAMQFVLDGLRASGIFTHVP
ncbi:MarC family protein [Enterovirga aerilata]|uniref:UPF0056 membrane protein n=1 Tax=Enterovirga aerilata TaxID=2730920 RepID=A0A849IES9_9HYPH|nr:MarC family protein [Enterovirga sp. DB1703]NNM74600.1 MarC family protein [Enterovirga sp. DB1703]